MKTLGQFGRFLAVGGFATALHYVILYILVELIDADPVWASVTGYIISAVFNYAANYHFTFASTRDHRIAFPRFMVVVATGLVLNSLLMGIGVRLLGLHYLLSQVFATGAVVIWNFFASRRWSFDATTR